MQRLVAVAAVLLLAGCFGGGGGKDPSGGSTSATASTSGPPASAGGATLGFTWSPALPTLGQNVTFTGTVKGLGERSVDSWAWVWGDGSRNSTGSPAWHTFAAAGDRSVRLNVLLSDGRTLSKTQTVLVLSTPGTGSTGNGSALPPPLPAGEFDCAGTLVTEASETFGADEALPQLSWAVLKTGFRFAVAWTSESPVAGTLTYTIGKQDQRTVTETVPTTNHLIVVDGLDENRTLCFTVGSGGQESPLHAVRTVNAMTSFRPGAPHGTYTLNLMVLSNEMGDAAEVRAGLEQYNRLLWDATDGWVRTGAMILVEGDPLHGNLGYGCYFAGVTGACNNVYDAVVTNDADPRGAASTYRQGIRERAAAMWMNQYHQAMPGPLQLDDLGAVLVHELGHYAFDMADLYGDSTVLTSECYDASTGVSIMAGNRDASEFDDAATPCANQPSGYTTSWELAQGQFKQLPDRPAGPDKGPEGDGGIVLFSAYKLL